MEWEGYIKPQSHESFFTFFPPQSEKKHTEWTVEENKRFENALAEFDPCSLNFFEDVASNVSTKSVAEIIDHYQALAEDIDMIESGLVEPPEYKDDQCVLKATENGKSHSSKQPKVTASQPKRKGIPWTEDEHRLFLKGLEEHGKGDWRSIARYWVVSKSPAQIASHAQKYFLRLETSSSSGRRRRRSIHDIQCATPTNSKLEQTEELLPPPPPPPPHHQHHHGYLTNRSSTSTLPITITNSISAPPENPEQKPLPPQSPIFYYNTMTNAYNISFPSTMTTIPSTTFPMAEPTSLEQYSAAYPSSSLPPAKPSSTAYPSVTLPTIPKSWYSW